MSRKELFICDGVEGKPCGAVLVDEHDGFVLRGSISTSLTGTDQKSIISSMEGKEEITLCRACFCLKLGLPVEPDKR